jgi:hypothetical protein
VPAENVSLRRSLNTFKPSGSAQQLLHWATVRACVYLSSPMLAREQPLLNTATCERDSEILAVLEFGQRAMDAR